MHIAAVGLLAFAILWGYGDTALMGLCALAAHESCHLITMLIFGDKPESVEITPFGGMICREDDSSIGIRPFLIALSGVLGSFLLSVVFMHSDARLLQLFSRLSWYLAIINLLPAYPLDGGRMLYALLGARLDPRRLLRALCSLSCALSVGLTLLAIYGAARGHINLTLLFVAPYIGYAACQNRFSQLCLIIGRSLRADAKLLGGKTDRIDARAASGIPPRGELIRFLSGSKYHMLVLIDQESGSVGRVLGEKELIASVLEEEGERRDAAFDKDS